MAIENFTKTKAAIKIYEDLTQEEYDALTKEPHSFYVVNDVGIYKGTTLISTGALVSGTNIKTINGESILGAGNIEVAASDDGVDTAYVENEVLYIDEDTSAGGGNTGLTEDDVNNIITSNETVIALTDEVRILHTDKQDTLVSGTNIKTINNETILGEGNIKIESGGSAITIVDSLPTANEENFEKGKIYTQGDLLKYITKIVAEEPNLSQVASLITAAESIGAAAVGTNIYLFGGYVTSASYLNTISKFDTTTNTLTTLSTTLPTAASSIAAAAVGTDIYLFGGKGGEYLNTINKFDTTTGAITTLSTTLPRAGRDIGVAAVGTSIYLFGGRNSSSSYLKTINKFDTTTGAITTLSTTLPTAAYGVAAASVGSNIYLFGGFRQSVDNVLKTINKFDTTTGAITTLSTKLPTSEYSDAAAVVGTNIYLFGGHMGRDFLKTIRKFDTTTNTITTLSITLPDNVFNIGTASVGTNVYLFGGEGYSGRLNTINKVEFGEYYAFETLLDRETGVTEDEVNNIITSNETIITLTDEVRDLQTDKQDALVSGTSIKTINNTSLLGSGNIEVGDVKIDSSSSFNDGQVVVVSDSGNKLIESSSIKTINGESILGEGNIEISGGGGETETIFEVNLEGVTLDEATYTINIPNQSIALSEEQLGTLMSNKNVVIKANLGDIYDDDSAVSIYLKTFPAEEVYGGQYIYYSVWYGFLQIIEGNAKAYNVGLKCVLQGGSQGSSLAFENVGLINENNLNIVKLTELEGKITGSTQEIEIEITQERFNEIMNADAVKIDFIAEYILYKVGIFDSLMSMFSLSVIGDETTMVAFNLNVAKNTRDGNTVYVMEFNFINTSSSGGETEVVANNGEETTGTLNTLKVGETNYAIPSGGDSPITIVQDLPTANEENFLLGKIYTQGDLLQYIAKLTAEEPNLSGVASLVRATRDIAAAAVGTNIYLFGGWSSGWVNTISKFDTTTNTLTTLSATLPTAAYGIAAAAVGTNIYLFGGYGTKQLNTINKFDTTTNTLTTLSATLPTKSYNIAATAVGTNIYLFGGVGSTNTINKFDTTTNTLTTLSTKLPSAAAQIAAAAVGTNIYLFGGLGPLNTINKFDTTTSTITTLSATLPITSYGIAATAVGANIYLFGGRDGEHKYLNTINKFDTSTNSLTTLSTTIPTAANTIATAAVGTNIYLFGGNGGDELSTINKAELGSYYQYKTLPNLDSITNAITNAIETEY